MQPKAAKRILFASLITSAVVTTIAAGRKGDAPRPRRFVALLGTYVIAAVLIDIAAPLGIALALLIAVSVILQDGVSALAGTQAAITRKSWRGFTSQGSDVPPEKQYRGSGAGYSPSPTTPDWVGGKLVQIPRHLTQGGIARQIDERFLDDVISICRRFNVRVSSAYRSAAANAAARGAEDSDHKCGYAADFVGNWNDMQAVANYGRGRYAYVEFATPDHMDHAHISFARCP